MLANELQLILRDALSNFESIRTPPEQYVSKYAWMSPHEQRNKVAQVNERIRYAKAIAQLAEKIAEDFQERINEVADRLNEQ